MSTIEIVAGAVLLLCSLIIVLVVLAQDSKDDGLTSAIGGGYNESFYEGNKGRTKDAKLSRITGLATGLIFVITLVMTVLINVIK
ncbi:MAG: preprotein translocase subunit SecG [Ruminococcus sp.]|nr:preprotein translocase subunit SecG [Ruminococcus sp.]